MAKLRRAKITSPATGGVVDIEYNEANKFDRRSADDVLYGEPVLLKKEGSGSMTLLSGTMPNLYNQDMTVTVEEVTVNNGAETITPITKTFKNVTTNRGISANNDGGESSAKVSFDFSFVV